VVEQILAAEDQNAEGGKLNSVSHASTKLLAGARCGKWGGSKRPWCYVNPRTCRAAKITDNALLTYLNHANNQAASSYYTNVLTRERKLVLYWANCRP
jgi:hypothetical protein